ncbi:hypothetical protein I4U23_017024 [Adineta vaga]|nr:hypothetical protein I4U23_017024 [Adineta vaga]
MSISKSSSYIGDNHQGATSSQKTSKKQSSNNIVYVPEIPSNIENKAEFERNIYQNLKQIVNIHSDDFQSFPNLGFGIIYVTNNEIKRQLVDKVQKMELQMGKESITISFSETLELVLYVVLDVKDQENISRLPTIEEMSKWIKSYIGEKPQSCVQLDAQFSNIYRLIFEFSEIFLSNIFDSLNIKGISVQIYISANCSFLEDVPESITKKHIQRAIELSINEQNLSPIHLYIQINEQTRNACIIVTGDARKWIRQSHLSMSNNKILKKRTNLPNRLCIHRIPPDFDIERILHHQLFVGKVTHYEQIGENLILTMIDKKAFAECSNRGSVHIDDIRFTIDIYDDDDSQNSDDRVIDASTWYKTEMTQIQPDIMQFVGNPKHFIFNSRWNVKVWLDEFDKSAHQSHIGDKDHAPSRSKKSSKPDQTRHLLRMTVMLNTIGTVWKKSYLIDDQEIKLNLDDKLQTIIYNHQSKLEQCEKIPWKMIKYSETKIIVRQEDCLVVYEDLVDKNYYPLLLNMANATTPGGGYKKGDGAQEENIFRRSDYFRSLDMELDEYHQQRAKRFLCTSDCQLEPIPDQKRIYPMDEFGAIYTSGLTIFRRSEDEGYAYMKKPLENVCAIAIAAYREPSLEDNMLSPKYSVGMRKKIENIFSIAYHHGHDSLVLSAFGCGAFKNPPEHVAQLFYSVIEQYAGFFKCIVFAIIDDHNTGRHLNREGNFKPFERLNGKYVKCVDHMNIPNTIIGPYRLLSDGLTVSDVCIFDSTPCSYGALCNIRDPDHTRNFSHPPLCALQVGQNKCPKSSDIVHMESFIHLKRCPDGGECLDIDNEKHRQEFEHPSYCLDGDDCSNMDKIHLRNYRHLPLCPESYKCKDFEKKVKRHCDSFRHCKPVCPHGNNCNSFHNVQHLNECQHPFNLPCPFTPYQCQVYNKFLQQQLKNDPVSHEDELHLQHFSHVCWKGQYCTDTTAKHIRNFIHITRKICSFGGECRKIVQEDHLNSFTHKNIPDIRPFCMNKFCNFHSDPDHNIKYRHRIRRENMEIVKCFDLNTNIDFVQNQKEIIERISNYFRKQLSSSIVPPNDILKWFRTVQPVYRCNQNVFELILLHQQVISQDNMKKVKEPIFIADSVLRQNEIRSMNFLKQDSIRKDVTEYIIALAEEEYSSNVSSNSKSKNTLIDIRREKERNLLQSISDDNINTIKHITRNVIRLSSELYSTLTDNKHTSNGFVNNEKTIRSILGQNLEQNVGDIFIVFKREILHHPDTNFSIHSAISIAKGEVYDRYPWFIPKPITKDEILQQCHKEKLHVSIPGYEYAAALELMATVSRCVNVKPTNVSLETILRQWTQEKLYKGIEVNLPGLIPINYIDQIYIPENILKLLDKNTQQIINILFKDSIIRIPFVSASSSQSISSTKCQDFVNNQLNKRFSKSDEDLISRSIRGFTFTIPSSKFRTHLLLPLTISQAFTQYRTDRAQSSKDNTMFIYWQAMSGDMMLTLSNEKNASDKNSANSRSFICYIAKTPVIDNSSYHENISYLNSGYTDDHNTYINNDTYAAGSNTFYVGCNTDDFMTFCLKIQRSTGKITLSHVASNSIYNHTIISHIFGKTELDLITLEYIRVSAGDNPVPIRNVMIYFEEQTDLHPTIDINIKKDSNLNKEESSSIPIKQQHKHDDRSLSPSSHDKSKKSIGSSAQAQKFKDNSHDLSLIPCRENVNCLLQLLSQEKEHNSKYSHPCRFSELCRNHEPNLTHEPHRVSTCHEDENCKKLVDPFHRAKYRHTGWSDYLIPCRFQQKCDDKSDKHRIRYSHGEQVFTNSNLGGARDNLRHEPNQQARNQERHSTNQIPCKWGLECRSKNDKQHCQQYSHPKPKSQ